MWPCSSNKLQKHQRNWVKFLYDNGLLVNVYVYNNKVTRYLAENRQKSLKNRQNFMRLKNYVIKHFKEATEPLKSKIGQFM